MRWIFLALVIASPSFAVERAAGTSDRYEVVFSTIAARDSFRLDRYTGDVDVLTASPDGFPIAWRRMARAVHVLDNGVTGKPHYRLFLSTIAARDSLLVNTETGATWKPGEGSGRIPCWAAIEDDRRR